MQALRKSNYNVMLELDSISNLVMNINYQTATEYYSEELKTFKKLSHPNVGRFR